MFFIAQLNATDCLTYRKKKVYSLFGFETTGGSANSYSHGKTNRQNTRKSNPQTAAWWTTKTQYSSLDLKKLTIIHREGTYFILPNEWHVKNLDLRRLWFVPRVCRLMIVPAGNGSTEFKTTASLYFQRVALHLYLITRCTRHIMIMSRRWNINHERARVNHDQENPRFTMNDTTKVSSATRVNYILLSVKRS